MKCRLCGCENKFESLMVKDLEMGTRDKFEYYFCEACGTLQIKDIPKNLKKYYPSSYYSFVSPKKPSWLRKFFRITRDLYGIKGTKTNFIGFILSLFFPPDNPIVSLRKIKNSLSHDSNILDIGCGEGMFLDRLSTLGFKNLEGIDPFIKKTKTLNSGVKLHKMTLFDLKVENFYNLVMFHHSFEHFIEDPFVILKKVNKILKQCGYCIIRIPTTSSYAWDYYRESWVGIQAPRHIMIYSIRGFEFLSKNSGFIIDSISFDSTYFSFVASEQYKRDIALNEDNSYFVNPNKSIFTKKEIKQYKQMALDLNRKCRGDWICVVLKKQYDTFCHVEYKSKNEY